jgi:hypothetical protein
MSYLLAVALRSQSGPLALPERKSLTPLSIPEKGPQGEGLLSFPYPMTPLG